MKISTARGWVENTYTEEDLLAQAKPIHRQQYIRDVEDFLVDRGEVALTGFISDLQAVLKEYPEATVYHEVTYESSEVTLYYQKYVRDETIEEVKERLAKEYQKEQTSLERAIQRKKKAEEKAKRKEERERALLEELNKKYGG